MAVKFNLVPNLPSRYNLFVQKMHCDLLYSKTDLCIQRVNPILPPEIAVSKQDLHCL